MILNNKSSESKSYVREKQTGKQAKKTLKRVRDKQK